VFLIITTVAFITIAVAIIIAVVITITTVITITAVTAKLCLRAKSVTLLPIIYIPTIKVIGLIICTNFIFLKELLRSYIVNT